MKSFDPLKPTKPPLTLPDAPPATPTLANPRSIIPAVSPESTALGPTKKRPLISQINAALGAFNQAGQQADALQERARQIPIPAPIIREGRGTVASTPSTGTNAAVLANQTIGAHVGGLRQQQQALAPQLDTLTNQVRQQTAQSRAQSAQQGANTLLAGVGAPAIPTPLPRPNFDNVAGQMGGTVQAIGRPATPARNPASPASTVGDPAGGVPAPRTYNDGSGQAYRTGDGRMGALPAGVDVVRQKNGTNAFGATGASVAAASGQAAAQPFGSLALPTAAPLAAQPNMAVSLQRPAVADAYNTREANAAQTALASKIDSEMFRNSFAAGRGSRSALDLQGQMLGTMAAIGGKQLDVAASVAGGNRDAVTANNVAGLEQTGLNQRALLSDTGDTNRRLLGEQGDNSRAVLAAQTELQKPSTLTDSEGNLLQVTGTQASPVLGAGNKPVILDSPQRLAARKGLEDAYANLALMAVELLPPSAESPKEADIGTARIRAAQLAGYALKRDKAGAMYVQIGGEWMPL